MKKTKEGGKIPEEGGEELFLPVIGFKCQPDIWMDAMRRARASALTDHHHTSFKRAWSGKHRVLLVFFVVFHYYDDDDHQDEEANGHETSAGQ